VDKNGVIRVTDAPTWSTISVIVPVHNGGSNFRQCLESLTATDPAPSELIVVADGDTDGSWKRAEKYGARVLRFSSSRGPAAARNRGAQSARGDILFFIDADVTVPSNAIDHVRTIFQQAPDLAAIFGSYDDAPAAPNFLSQYKNLLHHYIHQTAREDASTFWGACGAIRREVFFALGGFAEQYRRPSIEDIELGCRLKQAGYKIRLCRTLQVKHWKQWGARSLLRADFLYRALPWTKLIIRDRHLPNDLNLRLSSCVSTVGVYGLVGTSIAAWWWSGAFAGMGILLVLLLALNASLYCFFWRKRGLWFTVKAIPWHWFYYFYSGLAFIIGIMEAVRRKPRPATLPRSSKEHVTRMSKAKEGL
jgi:glycosyltransferase involved in cell wall biosynthesis